MDAAWKASVEARLAAIEGKSGTPTTATAGGASGSGAAAVATAPFVKAFDELLVEFFAPVEQGAKVGVRQRLPSELATKACTFQ